MWPFLILSFFLGAYALLPYFVLWKPPPPLVDESELRRWPLNFLESKLTAGVRNIAAFKLNNMSWLKMWEAVVEMKS